MDKPKILEIIGKIKNGTPAKNFEDLFWGCVHVPAPAGMYKESG